jgi:hypothetical protein
MINNVSNPSNQKVKGVKERGLDSTTIPRTLALRPSQEEIKRRIREKDWVTYIQGFL